MAIFKALTFDGVNSLDYGIYITGEAVYNAPERAVEMVNIPGKNGALALDQGRFENIEVTYHAGCFADSQADFADKVMKFRNALASRYTYKRLTDEYHPDEYRLGLYKSGLDVDAVRYGTAGEFNIVFDCKPQRFLTDGDRAISPTEWSDVQTESGELVTIDSDGSLAVRSLEVSLEPIQDLNGYDKPWVGGAGKNKLPNATASQTINGVTFTANANGTVKINGTATASADFYFVGGAGVYANAGIPTGDYILTGSPSGASTCSLFVVRDDGTILAQQHDNKPQTISIDSSRTYRIFARTASGLSPSNVILSPMIRLASVSDATYEPYSNICPISGRDSVKTYVTDEQKYDRSNVVIGKNWIGGTDATRATLTFDSEPSTRYRVITKGGNFRTILFIRMEDYTQITNIGINPPFDGYITTESNCNKVIVQFQKNTAITADDFSDFKCSISKEYESYHTDLPETVYGGSLDVVNGVLTVDRAMVDLGSLSWTYESAVPRFYSSGIASVAKGAPASNKKANIICSAYKTLAVDGSEDSIYGSEGNGGIALSTSVNLSVKDTSYTNATAFKTAVTGQQLVYELATPQTYQLTPQQIDLLLGTNHLWSDGEITVEYGVHPYYNPTPFDAKPLIKVTGTGTLGIGEYILTITGTASQTLYIDCETMEIYTLEGTVPTGASSLVSINKNDFPVLEPGTNYISVGSGITAVTITPRWWRI